MEVEILESDCTPKWSPSALFIYSSLPSVTYKTGMDFDGDPVRPPKLDKLFNHDGYLRDHEGFINWRYGIFERTKKKIEKDLGGYEEFASSYKSYGIKLQPDNSIKCKEWAPGADALFLIGDFNNWDRHSHPYNRDDYGQWSLTLPAHEGQPVIGHRSIVKVMVVKDGKFYDKISPWAKYVECDSHSNIYHEVFYNPPEPYQFKHGHAQLPRAFRIYESHVGISSPEGKVASYRYFADNVLPRIVKQGYNSIQLMAVMEHAYYASFGYQVTSFFGASSRYGTPDDLKYLIDRAHELGLYMLLDVVHSHACKNTADGLNQWDGTNGCYFHDSGRGFHEQWDSRLFNYTETEVLRFLLSNLRWWIDEYRFDGFRFDGVTSMMYHSHGLGEGFSGDYREYHGGRVDIDSVVYLMLANDMLHTLFNFNFTIAEDVSGMPALCWPINEGGVGFNARLSMAIPDIWIKTLKHKADEDWDLAELCHAMENRRYGEIAIAYAESHDQALVGDKTLAFWLMDKEMYWHMSNMQPLTPIIDRGIALHKMIRLFTHALGGEGWLNFIGNEFGHPEWLDFPRSGNNSSYHYARRQFNLVDDDMLRYKFLNRFDEAMNKTEEKYHWLSANPAYVSLKHQSDKLVAFERAGLVFVFNFNGHQSFSDYKIGVEVPGKYKVVLNSDQEFFGGHNRIDSNSEHLTFPEGYCNRRNHMCVYAPTRTALVFAKID